MAEDFPRHDLSLPFEAVSFDIEAFDKLAVSHGVLVEVYSAMMCPIGLRDPHDARGHLDHSECSNGFIYTKEGEVEASFSGNSSQPNFQGYGISDDSTAVVTFERFYTCGKPVQLGHYYRVYIKNCPVDVTNSEKIEHHPSGIDRLAYPAVSVQHLMDSRGQRYAVGTDFDVKDGLIHWRPGRSPGRDTVLNRGIVISVHYTYRPFYYIKSLPHEIRVSKDVDPLTHEVKIKRMQYQAVLQREWVFEEQERTRREKDSDRDVPAPRSGSFGPR